MPEKVTAFYSYSVAAGQTERAAPLLYKQSKVESHLPPPTAHPETVTTGPPDSSIYVRDRYTRIFAVKPPEAVKLQ